MGPRDPLGTVATTVEEAMTVGFRRRTLLPLDDLLGGQRSSIPRLTRSGLHRCLKRDGLSRQPESPDHAATRGQSAC